MDQQFRKMLKKGWDQQYIELYEASEFTELANTKNEVLEEMKKEVQAAVDYLGRLDLDLHKRL